MAEDKDDKVREEAVKNFAGLLLRSQGESILGVYLFGSVAEGTARPESDVDILVVYDNAPRSLILDRVSEVSLEIILESGVLVQPVIMTAEDFESGLGTSPFLWEVLTKGRSLYSRGKTTEWINAASRETALT